MKKYLTILFICFCGNVFSQTTYYVASNGSDANSGTISSPWLTVHYAATQVTTPGDTIYINAGTYIETLPAMVAVGVNIKGADSATTIIKSHYKADWNFNYPNDAAIAFVSSTEGTNGNQSLSGITLDGDNLTGNLGIVIKLRSNVIIHNINIKDFYINGVSLFGSSIDPYHKPTTYSQGNKLYNITITNCTDTAETWVGGGNINIAGQQDLLIHDFVVADTSRGAGANGDNIVNNRFGRGVKIYNGTSYKPSTENDLWNFHFEIPWGCGGTEIYNVHFIGGDCSIDVGGNAVYDEKTYPFLFSIHDNVHDGLNPSVGGTHGKYAITIEGAQVKNVNIYNERFNNVHVPISISDGTSGAAAHDSNIVISKCISLNTGSTAANSYQNLLQIEKVFAGGTLYNVSIINCTILPNATVNSSYIGITNNNGCIMRKITLANNMILNGKNGYWAFVDNTGSTMDSLISRNNIIYNNPNSNLPSFTGNTVSNYINSGNINSNPLLNSDGSLQSGSPAIGAAYPYGYGSDIGALQYTTIAPPTISVSGNQTITVANTSVSAVGTPASGQTITGYSWSKVSGAAVTLGTPTSASTTVSGLTTGTYVLRCTVTQSDGQTAYGEVTITVNLPANIPPTANAGSDQTITLPTSTVNLSGSYTTASGHTATLLWTKISGPGTQTILNNTTLTPSISGLTTAGSYVFQLKVTQDDSQFATSTVAITVNTAPPVVNAGQSFNLKLPTKLINH